MSSIINSQLVSLELSGGSKEEIIKELAQLIENEGRLNNADMYVEEVIRRETLSTTGIGFGIAIPHGKSNAVKIPTVAFGRIKGGVDWQSLDGSPVYSVFLLAVPEESSSNAHLKILAALSRKLMNEDFRNEIFTKDDEESIIEALDQVFKSALS